MPLTRGAQVPLPLALPRASVPRARVHTSARPLRRPRIGSCPVCHGPLAAGEGYVTCVVCGLRRAA